jgi:hypothetical protein
MDFTFFESFFLAFLPFIGMSLIAYVIEAKEKSL